MARVQNPPMVDALDRWRIAREAQEQAHLAFAQARAELERTTAAYEAAYAEWYAAWREVTFGEGGHNG